MAGSAVSWGLYFGWYSMIKKYMTKDKEGKLSPIQHLTASAEAGALTALVANPLWVIKTHCMVKKASEVSTGDWYPLSLVSHTVRFNSWCMKR
ncbi:hypothetical protein G6F36_015705 [Rhizopus arrhizus]|nr:hypothetical protein G6F36_015705 [Rhizopus arrhizus]